MGTCDQTYMGSIPFRLQFYLERVRRKGLFSIRSCRSLSRHIEQNNEPDDDKS